jgi:putative cell wall-binding protein
LEGSNNLALVGIAGNPSNDADRLITLAEAKQQSTYEALGWDFDTVWEMVPGYDYPQLQWQNSTGGTNPPTPPTNPPTDNVLDIELIIGEQYQINSGLTLLSSACLPEGCVTLSSSTPIVITAKKPGTAVILCLDADDNPYAFNVTVPNIITLPLTTKEISFWSGRAALGHRLQNTAIKWGAALFDAPATGASYDQDLAVAAMTLSMAAYDQEDKYYDMQDYPDTISDGYFISNALNTLEFQDIELHNYRNFNNQDNYVQDDEQDDCVGYSFAHKDFANRSGTTLVTVVIRGTQRNDGREWYSNFDIGLGEDHDGFRVAEQAVVENLEKYLTAKNLTDKDLKFLITGHSRGAAVANLLAAELTDEKVYAQEDIYGYTFATPNTTTKPDAKDKTLYSNINNFVNPEDFVPYVGLSHEGWDYWKYGDIFVFPTTGLYVDAADKANAVNTIFSSLTGGKNYLLYNDKKYDTVQKVISDFYAISPTASDYYNTPEDGLLPKDYFYKLCAILYDTGDLNDLAMSSIGNKYKDISLFFFLNHKVTPKFDHAHTPETYLAWLQALEPDEMLTKAQGEFARIACPVDVDVYDSLGNLVASVRDNVPEVFVPEISVYIDEDVKYLYLPSYENYTVKLAGTDVGTMDYTAATRDVATTLADEQKDFAGVALTDGKLMGVEKLNSDVRLFVVDENDKALAEIGIDGTETAVDLPLTAIGVDKTAITLSRGQSETLSVVFQPVFTTGDRDITWTTSAAGVATVTDGVVTALSNGTATVTATVGDKTATCTVTVSSSGTTSSGGNRGGGGSAIQPPAARSISKADLSYISGQNRVLTSVAISRQGWVSANTVILAPGGNANLIDALAVAPLAYQENAPILLSVNGTVDPAVADEIKRLGAKKIIAIGALNQGVIDQLRTLLPDVAVELLSGADRFATANLINARIKEVKGSFVVGYNAIADAVSIASWAAANGYVIQIANADGTTPTLNTAQGGNYILGGAALVRDIPGYTRIYGADRYATNQALREQLTFAYENIYTANGDTLVDALTGSVLAAGTKSAIVLTPAGDPAGVDFGKITTETKVYAFGGSR